MNLDIGSRVCTDELGIAEQLGQCHTRRCVWLLGRRRLDSGVGRRLTRQEGERETGRRGCFNGCGCRRCGDGDHGRTLRSRQKTCRAGRLLFLTGGLGLLQMRKELCLPSQSIGQHV